MSFKFNNSFLNFSCIAPGHRETSGVIDVEKM